MSIRRRIGTLVAGLVLGAGAAVSVAAAPASAAPLDVWGFAFNHDLTPLPGTVMDPTRQFGSWKPPFPADFATVDHVAPGSYLVRFPHIGVRGGVAHVTAVSGRPAWCQVGKFYPQGADQFVEVNCYRHGGTPQDTRFAIVFSATFGPLAVPGGGFAYVYTDPAGTLVDSYNSAGAPNATGWGGPGFYKVLLPGVGDPAGFAGNIQVTAAEPNRPRRCKVADTATSGTDVYAYVTCVDETSTPADSHFTLTYHRERPVFGDVAPPKRFGYVLTGAVVPGGTDFNSAGAPNTVLSSGVGLTLVVFEQLGIRETHAQVTAFGGGPDYCGLQAVWQNVGNDGIVRNVICFDASGARADNPSFVTFTSRV